MWEEPSHQQVFAEGPVRILDVRIAPGLTSDYHKHRFATAYVVIQDALVANQFWDDEWGASGPGVTVDNSGYVAKPYYHRVRNEDRRTFHVLAVINESDGTDAAATSDTSGDAPIDNRWFREHRLRVPGGQASAVQRFGNDVVLVQPTDGRSHVREGAVAHGYKGAPGAFSWHPAGTGFSVVNRGRDELEFVLIEIRD